MKDNGRDPLEWLAAASIVASLTAVIILLAMFSSSVESRAYNRLTGAQTTWWDAMWVELRVQGQPVQQTEKK